jgi:eukaryotic-like serine/threonine-protein kinase
MPIDPRDEALLSDWLHDWEDHYERGEDVSPEDFCAERLDLVEELRQRIALLKGFNKAFDSPPPESDEGHANGRSTASCLARYFDLKLHAEGGLGEVYEARDAEFSRQVALKFLKPGHPRHGEVLERFRGEAEITGRLEHPGIVPIYGMGGDNDGHPCYAMRFVRGLPMDEAIRKYHEADDPEITGEQRDARLAELLLRIKGKLRVPVGTVDLHDRVFRELLIRFKNVCETVAYAHSKYVLHRDLKPANVLLGKFGETLVVDWGLARTFEPAAVEADGGAAPDESEHTMPIGPTPTNLTPTAGPKGTPAYMSPEQASVRRDLGPASDVYSLGATLYCLLTGRAPFRGPAVDVVEQVRDGAFPPPRSLKARVPKPLEAICLKAMARNPKKRYVTAIELAEEVDNWLADRPVTAWREPISIRARRWVKRHRALVASATAVFVFGLIGLASLAPVLASMNRELEEQRRVAIESQKQASDDAAKARSSEAEAKATLEFLQNKVFAAARPKDMDGGLGGDVSLRAALDAAESGIGQSLADQPTVEAAIRDTLGWTYSLLGDTTLAVRQCERSYDLLRKVRGPDHAEAFRAALQLANALRDAGRHDEALTLFELSEKGLTKSMGPNNRETLISLVSLALGYRDVGRMSDALALLEDAVARSRTKLGPEHAVTLISMNSLANLYLDLGNFDNGIAIHKLNYQTRSRTLGPGHADTLESLHNLAGAYRETGMIQDAISAQEELVKQRERLFQRNHPRTLNSLASLALSYRDAGQLSAATKILAEVLDQRRKKLGPDHPDTLVSTNLLAVLYMDAGQPGRAIPILESAAEAQRAKRGEANRDTLISLNNLAIALMQSGQVERALPLLERVLAIRRINPGEDDPSTTQSKVNLARAYLIGKPERAEPLLREALGTIEKNGLADWQAFEARSLLGASLLGQKKYTEAEPLVLRGYEGMKTQEAKIPVPSRRKLTDAGTRIIELYDSWDKPENAAAWKARVGLADLPAEVFDAVHRP